MRACHVVYGYFPFDPRVRKEAETLRRFGHEIDVIALQDEGEAREETVFGFHVYRIPLSIERGGFGRYLYQYLVFLLASSVLLLRLHVRHRYGVVHVHSLPDFQIFCSIPERITGTRSVLDLHEAMPEIFAARFGMSPGSRPFQFARVLEWLSCAFSDAVIVQNETMLDLLTRRGVDPAKMTIVMNSPDPTKMIVGNLADLREELKIDSRIRTIVYVGGINAERDLGLLVSAVSYLRRKVAIRLLIFGYGEEDYRKSLSEQARAEGLGDDFFLGPKLDQEQVFAHLCLSEVGPITYERNPLTELTVPNKVFEYAAADKPLVIADLRTLRQLFGDAALYYDPGDAHELANQIQRLLENPGLAQTLVTRARRVLERCKWEIMAERLRRLYEELAQARTQS